MLRLPSLVGEEGEVVRELVVRGDDGAVARPVELGAAGAAEDLEDVEDADVDEGAALGVVDLGALDDDGVRRQVHAPRQRRRAAQDLRDKRTRVKNGRIFSCSQSEEKPRDHGRCIAKCALSSWQYPRRPSIFNNGSENTVSCFDRHATHDYEVQEAIRLAGLYHKPQLDNFFQFDCEVILILPPSVRVIRFNFSSHSVLCLG